MASTQNSTNNSTTNNSTPPTSNDAKRRVKFYSLNANKQWDDRGTGHVTSCYHEPLDGMSLLVRNESDGSLLLESKIQLNTLYQKQQETLIVWNESDNYSLALSFQERDGCSEIWEKICQIQGRDPSYSNLQDDDDQQEEIMINLVECDRNKLHLILEQINSYSKTTRRRDVLATEYIEHNYIDKLLEIFKLVDEEQDIKTLYKLYEIFKQLFLYDRPTLTEVMLSEQHLMDVIGVFEYEPPLQHQDDDDCHDQQQSESDNNLEQLEDETRDKNEDDPDAVVEQEHQESDLNQHNDKSSEDLQIQQKSPPPESQKVNEVELDSSEQVTEDEGKEQKSEDITPDDSIKDEVRDAQTSSNDEIDSSDAVPANKTQSQPSSSKEEQKQLTTPVKPEIINRKRHREFLLNGTTFKEVIPFSNQKLVDKIHQTYRVQYLQSSVLPSPSILEENAYASLTNILFFNKVEIVSLIQENEEFQRDLFKQIISNETGLERKRELVLFLREYCIFSQTITPKQRESFFKTLAQLKILSAVEVALSSNDQVIKSAAIDIFTYLVEYSPHMTREHAVQQKEGIIDPPNSNEQTANILKLVIEHITTDQDPELGTATQLACIIRLLLDPENMPGDAIGKHSFLEFFYFTCMQSLVEPIKKSTTPDGDIEPSANDRKTAQLLSIMLELVTFFMEHHYNQLRNYILSSDLLRRIISLIKSRHKFLVLSKYTIKYIDTTTR